MKVVFMGTPDFAVAALEALLASEHEVTLVVTQPDRPAGRGKKLSPPPVKRIAESRDLPVFQPEKINTRAARARVREAEPDVVVVVAFGQILRPLFLAIPPQGCLNVHASLLPRHRGASPINAQILHGDEEVGVSIMKMDEGLDTGPVAHRESRPSRAQETAGELHDRLAPLGGEALIQVLDAMAQGPVEFVDQDDTGASYAGLMSKSDGAIDFRASAEEIDRKVRGLAPWPGAFAQLCDAEREYLLEILELEILDQADPQEADAVSQPGSARITEAGHLEVCCGQGLLAVHRIKPRGKRAMAVRDWFNGARLSGALAFELPKGELNDE